MKTKTNKSGKWKTQQEQQRQQRQRSRQHTCNSKPDTDGKDFWGETPGMDTGAIEGAEAGVPELLESGPLHDGIPTTHVPNTDAQPQPPA